MAPEPRPRALVTAPMRGPGFEKLQQLCDVTYDPWLTEDRLKFSQADEVAERVAKENVSVLVVESDTIAGPVFDHGLVLIGSTRGDPNNVNLAEATAAGIPVINTPGRNADAVAEMAVGLLFAITRSIVWSAGDMCSGQTFKNGTIPYQRYRAWELAGQTVGIVGLGAVGRAAAWRFKGIGMNVISYDPYNPDATHSLDDLLSEADVVSMHAPVTPESTGMIGADQFARMKDGVVYINTARAHLHDDAALVDALRSGKISCAALDHVMGDRIDPGHPLCGMGNVLLTPHTAGATYNVEANQSRMIADDVERFLRGERPVHLVNPEVWK